MRVEFPRASNDVVRTWAYRNGVPCPERGQVPGSTRQRFDAARVQVAEAADQAFLEGLVG